MKWLISISIFLSILSCQGNPYGKGMAVYNAHCATCHGQSGEGLKGLIPPLANENYLGNHQDELPCIIRNGMEEPVTVNGVLYDFQKMPPNPDLSDIDIANVINFINNAWGNKHDFFPPEKVNKLLDSCH